MKLEGLSEQEMYRLCDVSKVDTGSCFWLYWPAELYGFGKMIREYAFYPQWLPLVMYCDHSGPSCSDWPAKHEIESDAPYFFSLSKIKSKNFENVTGRKSFVMLSPTVYFRKTRGINQIKEATGTIAFPAHSTPSVENLADIDRYAKQLLALPEQFHPVSVCLHMHDIAKGQHRIFQENGIPVFTAGNTSDVRFIERFYDILKRYKYSTSNLVGSYTFFSVEMGIPFFIYGEPQEYINKGDPNITSGRFDPYADCPLAARLYNELRLENFHGSIDPKLTHLVEEQLGIKDGISRMKMSCLLWASLIVWPFNKYRFRKIAKLVVNRCRR